jgi:hypothetical protein
MSSRSHNNSEELTVCFTATAIRVLRKSFGKVNLTFCQDGPSSAKTLNSSITRSISLFQAELEPPPNHTQLSFPSANHLIDGETLRRRTMLRHAIRSSVDDQSRQFRRGGSGEGLGVVLQLRDRSRCSGVENVKSGSSLGTRSR